MESPPTLVLIFGARPVLEHGDALSTLTQHVPKECCFGCSTAGEIENANVRDDTVVATGLWLERASFVSSAISLADANLERYDAIPCAVFPIQIKHLRCRNYSGCQTPYQQGQREETGTVKRKCAHARNVLRRPRSEPAPPLA